MAAESLKFGDNFFFCRCYDAHAEAASRQKKAVDTADGPLRAACAMEM